jgi:hypothetical protein
MLPNAFIGQAEQPSEAQLTAELGPARRLWDELLAALPECGVHEWKSYSRKAGWALRLKRGERAIVYLSPGRGGFTASFALGDRAVAAARAAGLPAPVVRIIDEAKKYAEGTAVRIDVKTSKDVAVVRKLVAIKLAN